MSGKKQKGFTAELFGTITTLTNKISRYTAGKHENFDDAIPIRRLEYIPGFARISLTDEIGNQFSIFGSSPPKNYEQGLLAGNMWGAPNVVWLIRKLIGEKGILFDIGANIGCVSLPIALAGHTVIAVEMIPENCLKLNLSRLDNRIQNLHIYEAAASSEVGVVQFGGTEAWGMVGHGDQEAAALTLDMLAQIVELDLAAPLTGTVVVKIDVEGHELSVLQGAADLISKHRPAVIFESIQDAGDSTLTTALECKKLLATLGYTLFLQYSRTLAPRSVDDFQEGLVSDFLALPTERLDMIATLDVRPLTTEERWAIVNTDAAEESMRHQNRAKVAARLLQESDPQAHL